MFEVGDGDRMNGDRWEERIVRKVMRGEIMGTLQKMKCEEAARWRLVLRQRIGI